MIASYMATSPWLQYSELEYHASYSTAAPALQNRQRKPILQAAQALEYICSSLLLEIIVIDRVLLGVHTYTVPKKDTILKYDKHHLPTILRGAAIMNHHPGARSNVQEDPQFIFCSLGVKGFGFVIEQQKCHLIVSLTFHGYSQSVRFWNLQYADMMKTLDIARVLVSLWYKSSEDVLRAAGAGNGRPLCEQNTRKQLSALDHKLPTEDQILEYLNAKYLGGSAGQWPEGGDIRQRLMFWTGGTLEAARDAAHHRGLYTLADLLETQYGSYTRQKDCTMWEEVLPMWRRMSLAMAKWARNQVTVRINTDDDGIRATSVWNEIERPILEANRIQINWIGPDGRSRRPIYPPPRIAIGEVGKRQEGNKRKIVHIA